MEHRPALILGDTPLTRRVNELSEYGWLYYVDVSRYAEVASLIEGMRPRVVVNAVEVSDQELCERAPDVAIGTNALGAANVAMACRLYDSHLIHLSTDQVFGGTRGPYSQGDPTYPHNSYGVSKLLGENAVRDILPKSAHIMRFGSMYGPELENCQPFIAMTQGGLRANNGLDVAYIDHSTFVNPTYIGHVAQHICEALQVYAVGSYWAERSTLVHLAPYDEPLITWHDLLVNDFQVRPYAEKAKVRQRFRNATGLVPTRGWVTPGYREGLDAFIREFREGKHTQTGSRT